MPTRAMNYPTTEVIQHPDDKEVTLMLRVPGSKFGSVVVTMTYAEAEALAADLIEASS